MPSSSLEMLKFKPLEVKYERKSLLSQRKIQMCSLPPFSHVVIFFIERAEKGEPNGVECQMFPDICAEPPQRQ